jgi:hypothetical protein
MQGIMSVLNVPSSAYHCGTLRGEASIIINPVERTAHSAGFFATSYPSVCGPPLTGSVRPLHGAL